MADQSSLPTPTTTPPPPATWKSISAEINAATRKQHARLNDLITARLPLALPPHSSNPAVLGRGLEAFAQIFIAFEEVWQDIEDGQHSLSKYDPDKAHGYDVCSYLAFLRPIGLARRERLMRDLNHIKARTHIEFPPSKYDEALAKRVRDRVSREPHTLIAYAWVMYMAIFSGGRWVREQLGNAGPSFWIGPEQSDKAERPSAPGYTFLFFDGDQDGEDIKLQFKDRLQEAETILSIEERQAIVSASQTLFDECICLVKDLDKRTMEEPGAVVILIALIIIMVMPLAVLLWPYRRFFLRLWW